MVALIRQLEQVAERRKYFVELIAGDVVHPVPDDTHPILGCLTSEDASIDSDGRSFDGAKTYRLNIPADVPAKDFRSVVVYDTQTRSELQTSQPLPGRNNKGGVLAVNADGSVDLYFGPAATPGHEANWIETVLGKSWFTYLRLYGPLDPWFDKTWQPGEIELIH
jgi:hypothetical protein